MGLGKEHSKGPPKGGAGEKGGKGWGKPTLRTSANAAAAALVQRKLDRSETVVPAQIAAAVAKELAIESRGNDWTRGRAASPSLGTCLARKAVPFAFAW